MAYLSNNKSFHTAIKREYIAASAELASVDAERECIKKAKAGDIISRNKLYYSSYKVLVSLATGKDSYFGNQLGGYKGYIDDLIAVALTELDECISDFDMSMGYRFTTFFKYRAFNAMNKLMYGDSLVHIPENHVKHAETPIVTVSSIHAPASANTDEPLINLLADSSNDIVEETEYMEQDSAVKILLDSLGEDSRKLLKMQYMDEGGMTLREVASRTGLSHEYVRKRNKASLNKLRHDFSHLAGIV